MMDTILATKLYRPAVRSHGVPRARLVAQLEAALARGHRLTLLSAPAGYGKSTLLGEWIAAKPGRAAWLTLDAEDNHASRFWSYLISALRTLDGARETDLGRKALQVLESSSSPAPQTVLTALLNDLVALDSPAILILDDYHVIANQDLHAGMTFLIEHQPESLHLVLATLADPPLPISRLRARGQLTELRIADMRFGPDETAAFLNDAMGLGLASGDVRALETRTEGWIAGLQLAALSMQGRDDPHAFIQAFTGSHHYILEYLADEVLQYQPAEVQAFMIETAILERMCAGLCNQVTGRGDGDRLLADLHRRNLFVIPLDGEHIWFRYHHLFADLLKGHLQRSRAGDVPVLHGRAADWYAANGYAGEALRHALAIPDHPRANQIVVGNWRRMYHQGRLNTAIQWLEMLPPELLHHSPPLSVAYCWTLFVRGYDSRIAPFVDETTRDFARLAACGALPPDQPEYQIVLQQVGLLKAVVARRAGDVATAFRETEQVLATVPGIYDTLGPAMVDLGYTACHAQMGYNYLAAGDFGRAADWLERVSPHARRSGNILALCHTTFGLAYLYLRQGQPAQADGLCREVLSLADLPEYSSWPAFCLVHIAWADVLLALKRPDEAAAHLELGLETARRSGHVLYLSHGYLVAARLHHTRGDATAARSAWQQAHELAVAIDHPLLNLFVAEAADALAVLPKTAPSPPAHVQTLVEHLSERELQVLRLICDGKSNREIADELVIALDTVKRHANNIYGKLGVQRRAQAIRTARELGLL